MDLAGLASQSASEAAHRDILRKSPSQNGNQPYIMVKSMENGATLSKHS